MLDPNPGLIIWTILTFLLLLTVLRMYAWKPILEGLRKREEGVKSTLERAEQARQEAERLLQENRKQLEQAEQQGQKILSESRALADKLKNEIVENANQQSRRLVDQAREEIERNKDAALSQLRGEVASLAITAAEKILGETLDEARQRRLVDAYLKDLPKN
ncbi:MAG TPA: F0F1 ATP synthase subunit B [Bacteroidota bacterium]|nr:F0F1 ATP synthase subunit B [Bacteroidota bacterium]